MSVVVITGLAQGMGREVALRLAAAGDTVAGFDVDPAGIESLRVELAAKGCDCLLTTLDVRDRPGILRFRDEVLGKYDHVDTVLSNVGVGFFGPFEEIDLDQASRCLEINVIGAAAILQAFLPSMRARRVGSLIAVSSLVGQIPFPFESIYSASKFALEGMVRSLRYEVEPFGVRVALIHPAQVATQFAAAIHIVPGEGSPYRDRVRRFIARDRELIKTAIGPAAAADAIVRVVRSASPKLQNPIDRQSRVFLALNRFLPQRIRDRMLLSQMDIA
jgi:NAD(P)-dependent dehydrogenase (short-subunit alcohol dehydrogenase family)